MISRALPTSTIARAATTLTTIVFATSSCEHAVAISPSSLQHPQSSVQLVLNDDTEIRLVRAYLENNDRIRGDVVSCRGEGCEAVHEESVPLARVRSIHAMEPDAEMTTAWVAAGAAVTIAGVASVAVAAHHSGSSSGTTGGGGGSGGGIAVSGMSCPRMYSWNGSDWKLDSGTFGGSLFATAQLTDHDLLEHLAPEDGRLRMRLKNELPETEHTDAISLRIVDHPSGTRVVPTASGKLLTFRHAEPPLVATDLRGADARDLVAARDEREWTSNASDRNPDRPDDARDGLVLEFPKPPGARTAKLWVAARNTPWASDMLLYLLSQLGPALPAWYAKMNGDAGARNAFSTFMENVGALVVSAKTPNGWTRRGVVHVAGPEILKDQALEVPVDDVPGDRVTLRLDAPVAFWSIDSVSLAFEDDEALAVRDLSPIAASNERGDDVSGALRAIDGEYYSTVTGNVAELSFAAPAPPAPGLVRSYVLVSTGYYVPEVTPDPQADPALFLRVTADPGAASQRALAMLNARVASRPPVTR